MSRHNREFDNLVNVLYPWELLHSRHHRNTALEYFNSLVGLLDDRDLSRCGASTWWNWASQLPSLPSSRNAETEEFSQSSIAFGPLVIGVATRMSHLPLDLDTASEMTSSCGFEEPRPVAAFWMLVNSWETPDRFLNSSNCLEPNWDIHNVVKELCLPTSTGF